MPQWIPDSTFAPLPRMTVSAPPDQKSAPRGQTHNGNSSSPDFFNCGRAL